MSTMSVSLFDERNIIKTYTYSDITDLLSKIECPVNKFLSEVKKVIKLKKSAPIWYEFSDSLIKQHSSFKNKDHYASVYEDCKTTRKNEKYNFRCCPQTETYYTWHCLYIVVNDGIVKVIGSYEEST